MVMVRDMMLMLMLIRILLLMLVLLVCAGVLLLLTPPSLQVHYACALRCMRIPAVHSCSNPCCSPPVLYDALSQLRRDRDAGKKRSIAYKHAPPRNSVRNPRCSPCSDSGGGGGRRGGQSSGEGGGRGHRKRLRPGQRYIRILQQPVLVCTPEVITAVDPAVNLFQKWTTSRRIRTRFSQKWRRTRRPRRPPPPRRCSRPHLKRQRRRRRRRWAAAPVLVVLVVRPVAARPPPLLLLSSQRRARRTRSVRRGRSQVREH